MKRATISLRFVGFAVAISIHALVKRATPYLTGEKGFGNISIHALVKRATFGFRPSGHKRKISIHALVKRATRKELFFMVYK